jgi:D-lactate dehydrogenase
LKIAFFETEEWEREYLEHGPLSVYDLQVFGDTLSPELAKQASDAEVLSGFIYSRVDRAVIDAMPNLKMVATRSTGYDHIDLEACKERGISVANVPHYGESTVAEHTFGLILSLSRNIHKAYLRTTRTDFSMRGLTGFDLSGKTFGVVGAGKIGLHAIKISKGFGMKALAFDVHPDTFLSEVLGFDYVSLEDLLQRSDIISLHAPYNKATHHLINRDNIHLIKKGAVLINTSRGALVETEALVLALEQGILSGVGLDVLEGEDLIKEENQLLHRDYSQEMLQTMIRNHILLHREDVVITPHIAFNSREALNRILETTVENVQCFLDGTPQNIVRL